MELRERFEKKFERVPWSGCWFWTDFLDKDGYGQFGVNNKAKRAHRVSYELYKGEIPQGKMICHRCDIPCCVNPEHLFVGTSRDNMLDASKKGRLPKKCNNPESRKTHCINGHEFTPDSIYMIRGRWRSCRICQNQRSKKYRAFSKIDKMLSGGPR